jgi:hypothetical protein
MMGDNDMAADHHLIARCDMDCRIILDARSITDGNGPKIGPDNRARGNETAITDGGIANDDGLRMDKRPGRYSGFLACKFIDRHRHSFKKSPCLHPFPSLPEWAG